MRRFGTMLSVLIAGCAMAQSKQTETPKPPTDVEAIVRAVQTQLPPGTEVEIEVVRSAKRDAGSGEGASASATGDNLSDDFSASAPTVDLGAGFSASGGGAERSASGEATFIPASAWANPLFWLGVAAFGVAGYGWWRGMRRLALSAGVVGLGCLAIAFYPVVLLWAVGGLVAYLVAMQIWSEQTAKKNGEQAKANHEAARASVAAVALSNSHMAHAELKKQADQKDMEIIRKIVVEDELPREII